MGKFRIGKQLSKVVMPLAFASTAVNAQDTEQTDMFELPLQELKNITVSSIDFSNRSLKDSFASAHVITSQMIDNMPMITLADYIEMLVPSTNIVPQGNNGAGVGIRGSAKGGAVRTLTMWDGHSQNRKDSQGNSGVLYSPLLNDLHQIEVVLGPGSIKHGTGAIDGYINFVPKSGQNFQGSKVDLDYGSDDHSQRLQMQHGKRIDSDHDFYVYAGIYHADGFRLRNDFGGSIAPVPNERNKFANRDQIITGDYDPSYKLSMNWTQGRFNLKSFFEHLEFDPGGVIAGKNTISQRSSLSVQPKYTFQLPGKTSFELSSAATLFDRSGIRRPINERSQHEEVGGRESALELRGSLQTFYFDDHELTLGAQIKWLDTTSEKHFFSADPNTNRANVDGKWQEYSMYLEDIFSLTDKTTFIAGLRYDGAKFNDDLRFETNELDLLTFRPPDISDVSPRLALTHKFDNDFLFRAGYSEGFAYPNVSSYSRTFRVNEFLESRGLELFEPTKPGSLKTYEIGLRGDLIKNELLFDLSFYYNRYGKTSSFVNFRNNPSFLPGNLGVEDIPDDIFGIVTTLENGVDGYGSELSLNWQPNNSFFANLSYSYATPDHVNAIDNESIGVANDTLSEWSHFPKHQVKSNFSYTYKKWLFNLAGIYQSGLEINRRFTPTRSNGEDAFVRVNLGVNYMLNEKTNISFVAKNIFNNNTPRTTFDPSRAWQGALGSDERLFYLGLSYSF